MGEFKDNQFYLEIKLKNGRVMHVMTPSVDFPGMVFEYTYGDVIDSYTTKFNNMYDLLDDIRNNGYADISDIDNDSISSISFRYKDNDKIGCYPEVAYSDSLDVINYLQAPDNYRKVFEENFMRYVVGRVLSSDKEYCVFLAANFVRVYSNSRRCDYDKFVLGEYKFNSGGSAECFSKYHNIRAHCLINHDKLEAKFDLERELKKGTPYDAETALDLKEARENASKEYTKRSVIEVQEKFLGERFIPYPIMNKVKDDGDNVYESHTDFRSEEPLTVEDGIVVDNLVSGASLQDQVEFTINPDTYEEFLNSNPVMEDVKKRR